ncbi:uncharacterized protein LAJ45_10414 [Morchella importuna]|uniref:uncharacterized protein n=1 Tax=Morchella importuna TaxID=1174673 RepID=UPI001E8E54D2|nr:uncharacterized protein LAJ45_10414 [Morchella importuna]KAH8145613.1 hypothetical protein LAJ45_10414 [Morchella importuna]
MLELRNAWNFLFDLHAMILASGFLVMFRFPLAFHTSLSASALRRTSTIQTRESITSHGSQIPDNNPSQPRDQVLRGASS